MKAPSIRREAGFSILELAVCLALVGVVGLVAWRLVPDSRSVAGGDPVQLRLRQAQDAVEGFVLRRSRLPCPAAVGGTGNEVCGADALGELPWRTLGLSRTDGPLRYGVYRANTVDGVAINLASAASGIPPKLPPAPALPIASYNPAQVNGLDFCQALRLAASAPNGLLAGGVPVAYAVAAPGADRAFNAPYTVTFPMPGAPATPTFDDRVAATGLGELSARLGCVTRMGEVEAAARSAYAAFDLYRDADMFDRFRSFAYQVRITDRKFAEADVGLASLDMLIAIGTTASSVSLAANSVGVGAGTVVAAVGGIGAAAAALVAAGIGLASAIADELKTGKQAADATVVKARMLVARDAAVNAAAALDTKGLLP